MVGKMKAKMNRGLVTCRKILICVNMCNRTSKGRAKESKDKAEKIFKEIITTHLPTVVKNINL
jgi:hypothetical protein